MSLEPWITREEEEAENRAARRWASGFDPEECDCEDEKDRKIAFFEVMLDMGLDPYDPDFSDLAAEGLEGNEDGNYDDERDDRVGDDDPVAGVHDEDEDDLDDEEEEFDDDEEEEFDDE